MAPWTMKQHAINAVMWAGVGAFVIQNNYLASVPLPAALAGLAVVYSYATDMIEEKFNL